MATHPKMNPDVIRRNLQSLSRDPFKDILQSLIEAAPDGETLKEWAAKAPDRWSQALAITGRLSGYTEKSETTVTHDFSQLSDAELLAKLAEHETNQSELLEGFKTAPETAKTGSVH